MNYISILIICLVLPFFSWAQPSSANKKTGRVGIGLYYNPSFTYRILSGQAVPSIIEQRNQQEIAGFSQSVGAMVNIRIIPKLYIALGVLYGDRSYRTRAERLDWGTSIEHAPESSYLSFHHYYGDIPVKINYHFYQKASWSLFAGLGIISSMFGQYNRNTHLKKEGGWQVSNKDKNYHVHYDRFSFFALLEGGVAYQLNKTFQLTLAATSQVPLKAANSNLPLQEYFYSVGLGVGILYTPLVKVKNL